MQRFLIEVPHKAEFDACVRVVEIFLKSGSHYLTHAHWGCMDGVHKSWIIAEVGSKEEAAAILPPALRSEATIIGLNDFTLEQIENMLEGHKSAGA